MNLSRRQFLRLGPAGIMRETARRGEAPPPAVRPPGALADEQAFLAKCTATEGCRACFEACTFDAVLALGPEYGDAEGTPHLELLDNPCRWCQPMVCIEACETGALHAAPDEPVGAIAKVALDLGECLNRQGTLCSDCSDFCPPSVRALRSRGREPSLDVESCVGCGLCIWHCDADGAPLTLVIPNAAT